MLRFLSVNVKYRFSESYLRHIQQLHHQQRYHQIFGIKSFFEVGKGQAQISKKQFRKIYLNLIKKYHSDKCQNDPVMAKQYEEISKIIISAYYNLEKLQFPDVQQQYQYIVEDQICQQLFKKKYNQAKYWMYQKGNQKQRQLFLKELQRRTGQNYRTSCSERPQSSQSSYYASPTRSSIKQQKESGIFQIVGVSAIIFLGFSYILFNRKSDRSPTIQVIDHTDKMNQIAAKEAKKVNEKTEAMISSLLKDQPPCLKYPRQTQPHLFEQLTQYSIAPDIHLFQVPSRYFKSDFINQVKENPDIIKEQQFFPISRIKPNTVLTLSLQAERALHNIYVKVKDIIEEIEKKGKYNPPKILIRFHGYLGFEIREKPLSLKNYKNTDYISLFDLYFDYYSPIFLKKDQYCQYLVGKDEPQLFGWVHFNKRICKPVYLQKNQKYAYFFSKRTDDWEYYYRNIWENYYRKYISKWSPLES